MNYIIVGLGNPDPEYTNTRHNTGRVIVDAFHKKKGFPGWEFNKKLNALISKERIGKNTVTLLKPETSMNRSGNAVAPLVTSIKKAHNLVVVHDDIDMPLGNIKILFNRGSGGHNGVESVRKKIKTKEFVRVKIGVSPSTPSGKIRKPKGEEKVYNFLLGKFKEKELKILKKISKKASEAVEIIISEGKAKAMNLYN